MPILYCITCAPTRQTYIGATRLSLKQRWVSHVARWKRGTNTKKLQAAYDLYGAKAFEISVLGEYSLESIGGMEKYFLLKLKPELNHAHTTEKDNKNYTPVMNAYDGTCRKRRTYVIDGKTMTMKEIKEKYPHYVIARFLNGETGKRLWRPKHQGSGGRKPTIKRGERA